MLGGDLYRFARRSEDYLQARSLPLNLFDGQHATLEPHPAGSIMICCLQVAWMAWITLIGPGFRWTPPTGSATERHQPPASPSGVLRIAATTRSICPRGCDGREEEHRNQDLRNHRPHEEIAERVNREQQITDGKRSQHRSYLLPVACCQWR